MLDARLVAAALVLLPGQSAIHLSRSLDDEAAADLRKMLAELNLPDGFGVILRRHTRQMIRPMLQTAIDQLVAAWQAESISCVLLEYLHWHQ